MSGWYNVDDGTIRGLNYDNEEPTARVGVALSWYDVARLAIRDDAADSLDTVLLGPTELRRLAERLLYAAERIENTDPEMVTCLLKTDAPQT